MKQSATQVFCLFCHLTFYVGDCIPSGNQTWQLYLLLREICDIIMSRKIPFSHIALLQRKIQFFIMNFISMFPAVKIPCKMHYLIHYPSCILKFGPLVELWAMRFEAKHQYFKNISRKIRNFKNISKSLAMRHQFYQCFSLVGGDDKSVPTTTGCHRVLYEHLPDSIKQFIFEQNLDRSNSFAVKSVSVDGWLYKAGCALVVSVPEDTLPKFVQVREIFYVNKFVLLLANILDTICFDEHFHAYAVCATQEDRVFTSFSDWSAEPLYIREHNGRTISTMRHSLF
ncbi:conserved hypothetical protein [Ixodes scapularis]|uniref:Uncharacterized protein n=1 Tax=Ixodes scapularis TaxID=6945 RepID=B7PLM7_IXOSC|nr:conserved hypothetical protein [Ixodes scapularis]|eukprot:XP_002434675.1 conserved hypothetical protein [Ixodes scapularis]